MVTLERLSQSRWSEARWLVLAPHPDDETLGTGALIATLADAGRLAGVVYLTDGSGSHPHADDRSRRTLIETRRAEARAALEILCVGLVPPVLFLDWPDARPHPDTSTAFLHHAARLADLCRTERVTALAATALHEPHCDHAAAARLARAVTAWTGPAVSLFEYLVWSDAPPAGARIALDTDPLDPAIRALALHAHRSQLTARIGQGFRLPPHMLAMPERDRLYLWEGRDVV